MLHKLNPKLHLPCITII